MDQVACFAGGCFWCTEPVFSQLKGVQKVVCGYIGGHTQHPTYEAICKGDTGHAEAVKIHFDDSVISYETLLEIFLVCHDPTTLNRQGNDVGTQYRSAIFCVDEVQLTAAKSMLAAFNADQVYSAPIVTEVNASAYFWPAEEYHQYYFAKNPNNPYCLAVAAPKAAKIRAKYKQFIKNTSL